MNTGEFIDKWSKSELKETASFQSFFDDLCRLVGHEPPASFDAAGEVFTYEKYVTKSSGTKGYADAWYKGHFAWEHKGKYRDLTQAYKQLRQYMEDLENPPLLVVSDFATIIIHTNFNNTRKEIHRIALDELPQQLHIIESLFFAPENLKPQDIQGQQNNSLYSRPQLRLHFEPLNQPTFMSQYGLIRHGNGPCPPLEGSVEMEILLSNESWRAARHIKVDLEVRMQQASRPEIRRYHWISSEGWRPRREAANFVSHQFIGGSDDVCLEKDDIHIGTIEFMCELPVEQTNASEIEDRFYTDPTGLSFPLILRVADPDSLYTYLRQQILEIYAKESAEDMYRVVYRVSAEGFEKTVGQFDVSILWKKEGGSIVIQ